MKNLIIAGRVLLGAWMLINGANHFLSLYPEPVGHEALAAQLMASLIHSRLLDVVMVIQVVTGALILAGLLVPLALCVLMPTLVCAVYWSVILEHRPLGALLALVALALNGLLMLAYLDDYRGVLQRRAFTLGESAQTGMNYETLFAYPGGRTSRAGFIQGLVPLLAVAVFYYFLVRNRNGDWVLVTLLYPAMVLHARRLHDMGLTALLLLIPGAIDVAAIWLHLSGRSLAVQPAIALAAVIVSAAFIVWGLLGKGEARANRFGEQVPAHQSQDSGSLAGQADDPRIATRS